MKKILVTGGSGFIGANFIHRQISETNNLVLNYDKLTYAGNNDSLSNLSKNKRYSFIKGDICDAKLLNDCLFNFKPDFVINFAAESHVDRSIDKPFDFIKTNIVGAATIAEECLRYYNQLDEKGRSIFRLLHVSTDEVFGSLGKDGKFTESTSYDPSSPYSASKASSDHLIRSWNRTFGLPIIITNCSNNYGPYQFPEKLIPLMILNILNNKPLPVYGKGDNIRDWLFVDDHCDALYCVLKQGVVGDTYNIGGNNEISNIDIVAKICDIMDDLHPSQFSDSHSNLISFVKDRPGHDFRYAIDCSKIKEELGWEPKVNFEDGIEKTISWYLKNVDWWKKIQNLTYNQERLGEIKK